MPSDQQARIEPGAFSATDYLGPFRSRRLLVLVAFTALAAAPGELGRAHAVSEAGLSAHADGEWTAVDLPVDETSVDVAYGEGVYVVTAKGTLLADAGDGWRAQSLGVRDVHALVVA